MFVHMRYVECFKSSCCPDAGGPILETCASPEFKDLCDSLKQAVQDSLDELDKVEQAKHWLGKSAVAAAENALILKMESMLEAALEEVTNCGKLSDATLSDYYAAKEPLKKMVRH